MKVVLINPYELGRQPFALAQPAALLRAQKFEVACLDLSLQKLEKSTLENAGFIAIYLGMHTATRIALEALPKLRLFAPNAIVCVYGLYAPINAKLFERMGVRFIFGGEVEADLLAAVNSVADQLDPARASNSINTTDKCLVKTSLDKQTFLVPDRMGLPALSQYAHLDLPDGNTKVVGFVEGSRGCKHLCRHCPVVPVYHGRFRIIPVDVVMADIRQQVAQGAEHISFGDPDFLNGPTHALKLARALNDEYPHITFDATIKIEHILKHADLLGDLSANGCLFVTSAVESVDEGVLQYLDKNHSAQDFHHAVSLLRDANIEIAPTFVPFTPWTTLEGYLDLLETLLHLELVESVPPVQLSIRLLIPAGSYLLDLPGFREKIGGFNELTLGYPWQHEDKRVDELQKQIQLTVMKMAEQNVSRRETFCEIWRITNRITMRETRDISQAKMGKPIPAMSEPWYCCAEPTDQQLAGF